MEYSYLTDPGKVRDHNEDSVTALKNASGEVLMAVADGMGGHKDGEVASSIAINHIGKRFLATSSVGNKEGYCCIKTGRCVVCFLEVR